MAAKKRLVASKTVETASSVLRIVHAGGMVECYYMAIPAGRITEKYPAFILARPEVFIDPWRSVVAADEILIPGGKYFLVSHRVIRKLRRRIKKPSPDLTENEEEEMSNGGKRRVGSRMAWQPTLTSIDES